MGDVVRYQAYCTEQAHKADSERAEFEEALKEENRRFEAEKLRVEEEFDSKRLALIARLQTEIQSLEAERLEASRMQRSLDDKLETELLLDQNAGEERDTQLQAEVNALDKELEKLEIKYDQMDRGVEVDKELRSVREKLEGVAEELEVSRKIERDLVAELSLLDRDLAEKQMHASALSEELEDATRDLPSLPILPDVGPEIDSLEEKIFELKIPLLPATVHQITMLVDSIKSLEKRRDKTISQTRDVERAIAELRVNTLLGVNEVEKQKKVIEYIYKKMHASTPAETRKFDHLISETLQLYSKD